MPRSTVLLPWNEAMTKKSSHRCEPNTGHITQCRVLAQVAAKQSFGDMVRLTLRVHGWMGARAGQFVLLQSEPSRFFLGRALSVSLQDGEDVSFLVSPVGEGTRELCALVVGSQVWVLGPLGNGFDLEAVSARAERVVLVAGGAGVAPMPLLMSQCRMSIGSLLVLAGFRDARQALAARVLVEQIEKANDDGRDWVYEVCTEDGSQGRRGKVTDLLREHVRPGDNVVVCGPDAMARSVWQVCRDVPEVRSWFSLEAAMACGVGSCHGCVVKLADGSYSRVCREGPVFEGEAVFGA